MPAKNNTKLPTRAGNPSPESESPGWQKMLLTLTLVPLILGVLLIGAWALDIVVLNSMENQIVVGTLFLFFSFAASNALQKKWPLAAGWSLLLVADYLVLSRQILWVQISALVVGGLGIVLIGYEYFRQIAARNPNRAK